MAEYNNLMATINAQIKANGNQEITGPVLNAVLAVMVNVLGTGYRFIGVAHDTDNPGTPDNRVVYIAAAPGEYTDFDDVEVPDDNYVYILTWDSAWTAVRLPIYYDQAVSDMLDSYIPKPGGTTAGHLAQFDGNAELEDSGVPADSVITDKGTYPEVEAGAAQSLGTFERAAASFLQRIAGGGNCGTGPAHIKQIRGRSLVWNQLVENGKTLTFSGSIPSSGYASQAYLWDMIAGHIYYIRARFNAASVADITRFTIVPTGTAGEGQVRDDSPQAGGDLVRGLFSSSRTAQVGCSFRIQGTVGTSVAGNSVDYINFIDLTQMFGAGNEPTTPEQFEALYPLPYYSANPGDVKGFAAQTLQTTQLQQWDEQWELGDYDVNTGAPHNSTTQIRSKNANPIPVFPNTDYCFTNKGARVSQIFWYDKGGNFISRTQNGDVSASVFVATSPAGAYYCKFQCPTAYGTTYNHDICINLSGFRNGEYEPYKAHTLPIAPAEWRNNGDLIYPDGMQGRGSDCDYANVEEDGYIRKTTRVWASRGYQAGDESDASVITDGSTTTWYKLNTPETLTLDTPIWASFYVNQFGTERWLPENTATPYTAPCDMDVIYPVAPSVGYVSADSLKALLEAMKTAGVISAYTMTYDAATNKYAFTVTA